MIKHFTKSRDKRKSRIRAKISGTHTRPRLSVFRSHKQIYAQLVNDEKRITLLGMSDVHAEIEGKNRLKKAHELGKLLASEAKKKKILRIVFDRSGYSYHGRIKALAQGLREGGLVF